MSMFSHGSGVSIKVKTKKKDFNLETVTYVIIGKLLIRVCPPPDNKNIVRVTISNMYSIDNSLSLSLSFQQFFSRIN